MNKFYATFAVLALIVIGVAATNEEKNKDFLTLTSPNGKYSITLNARNDGAGIWVSGPESKDYISIVNGFSGGSYVGVGMPNKHGTPLAMGTYKGEPFIQFQTDDPTARKIQHLKPEKLMTIMKGN